MFIQPIVAIAMLLALDVQSLVRDLASTDVARARNAMVQLREHSAAEVVPLVIQALEHEPGFEQPTARDFAYGVLRDHRAAEREDGFEQLLRGLHEGASPKGLDALAATPPERFDRLVPAIIPLLSDARLDDDDLNTAVGLLAMTGERAAAASAQLVALSTQAERADRLRASAKAALFIAIGIEATLQRIGYSDITKMNSSDASTWLAAAQMAAVATVKENTNGIWQPYPRESMDSRRRLQNMVMDACQHDDNEVRKAALLAISPVFGPEMVVGSSPAEFRINPTVDNVLRRMMQVDSDPYIKDRAYQFCVGGGSRAIVEEFKRAYALAHSTTTQPATQPHTQP